MVESLGLSGSNSPECEETLYSPIPNYFETSQGVGSRGKAQDASGHGCCVQEEVLGQVRTARDEQEVSAIRGKRESAMIAIVEVTINLFG
jgi:hypothetical protein